MNLRLYKYEKLCSRTAIDSVFAHGKSVAQFPLRAVYSIEEAGNTPARFLITIPKKKIRKAVNRVLLRRRVREAYRLNRHLILPALQEHNVSINIAFLYIHNEELQYHHIQEAMTKILSKIAQSL